MACARKRFFRPGKVITIHNGIDVKRFEQGSNGTGVPPVNRHGQDAYATPRVGMIGHLAPIKGQEDFIRAAAIVCGARHRCRLHNRW